MRRSAQRVAALIGDCSIELSPRDELAGEALRKLLDPGTTVFVNHPPSVTHHDIVAACARLRRAGFDPVPHVAARRLASFTQASDFLQRAAGEAGVERILLIGGDDSPSGRSVPASICWRPAWWSATASAMSRSPATPKAIRRSMHRALDAALQAKVALARQRGLDVSLVTQFGFEAAADPALDRSAARAGHRLPGACRHRRTRHCGDLGEVRDPLRHRCVVARAGARPYGVRAHHGGGRT